MTYDDTMTAGYWSVVNSGLLNAAVALIQQEQGSVKESDHDSGVHLLNLKTLTQAYDH